jgi:SPP1 family predicted phage head-tail adaptor
MASAGDFNQKLIFEIEVRTDDGFGGASISWNIHATVWASVKPVQAREDERQGAQRASCMYMIETWASGLEAITSAMRINWRGTILNIREIRKPDERKMTIVIMAETGVVT